MERGWGDRLLAGAAVPGYPVATGSLTARMRSIDRNGVRREVQTSRTTARPREPRMADTRVQYTPRGRSTWAWRRRDPPTADRAR